MRPRSMGWSCVPLLIVAMLVARSADAGICYVNAAAGGSNTGASWANAYTDLQSALANFPACTDIYIARGTYKPTQTADRTISFNIRPSLAVYGGFAGTEASLDDRLLAANQTILSGDIGAAGDASDNSYHVVAMDGTTASGGIFTSTIFSDLTIRDGNADGAGANQSVGGGLYCNGQGAGHECSPELDNLIFEDNRATSGGGAICNDGHGGGKSSPTLRNAIVRDNDTAGGGGGIYNNGSGSGSASSPVIEGVTFTGNTADLGGAMFNNGLAGTASPTIRNSTFYANTANGHGGAILDNGSSGGHASPIIRYTTFHKNRAISGNGGAIYNIAPSADAAPNLSGVIFWADQAVGSPVENFTSFSATVGSLEYSITPECPGGAVGCVNADPLLGALQDNDGFAPTLKPAVGSPAIDAGNATNCPANDARGIVRPQGAKCDIGAVELRPPETHRCYANRDNLTPGDGSSWATAYSGSSQAIYSALINANCSEVWVAKGSYGAHNLFDAAAFSIPPGKAVYGGFAGTETALSQRDFSTNATILDGQSLYHVVVIDAFGSAKSAGASTVLDGFTIQNGHATGPDAGSQSGGGLLCNSGTGYVCNPTLANLVFKDNSAVNGGALFANSATAMSSPTLRNVTFTNNQATQQGGAYFGNCTNGPGTPVFSDVAFVGNAAGGQGGAVFHGGNSLCTLDFAFARFEGNTASAGGAMATNATSVRFLDVVFRDNQATGEGGAVFADDSGGVSTLQFTSTSFFGNHSTRGGGVSLNYAAHSANVAAFDHATLIGNASQLNDSSGAGGAVIVAGGSTVVRDSLFADNGPATVGGALSTSGVATIIDRSTFTGNVAQNFGAGAVYLSNTSATITNSTFRDNIGYGDSGGAIRLYSNSPPGSNLVVRNATFSGNQAPGHGGGAIGMVAYLASTSTATLSDSILWGDSAASNNEVEEGVSSSVTIDHSIVQGGCPAGGACSTLTSADPLLGAFLNYGGFTPVLMPAENSPALNVGVSCTSVDQRGVARPQGAACDLGAVERRALEDTIFNSGFDF